MSLKKLFILPILLTSFIALDVLAGTCGGVISYSSTQEPDDNEFLYSNKRNFELAQESHDTGNRNSGNGVGYECDSSRCGHGHVITLKAGHVFEGRVINHAETYQCDTAVNYFDDRWVPMQSGKCNAGQFGTLSAGDKLGRSLTYAECSGTPKTDENGTEYDLICQEKGLGLICKATKCKDNFKLDKAKGTCSPNVTVPATNTTPTQPENSGNGAGGNAGGNGGSNALTCEQGRPTAEGKACCHEKYARWDKPSQHCICQTNGKDDSNKEFKMTGANRGKCVAKNGGNGNGNNGGGDGNNGNNGNGGNGDNGGNGGNSTSCNFAAGTTVIAEVSANCANNATYKLSMQTSITQLQAQVTAGANCDVQIFNKLVAQLQTMAAACEKAPAVNQARLDSALQTISSKTSTLGTSVWKDAEGNFNKARLASDSIAGVVLGTVGGVVTGHVVKKNQIKKGFEDITCTVGGQEVGSYGDEIVVGRQ